MSAEFNLNEVVGATQGTLLKSVAESFKGVGTDTRKDLTGKIFIALAGDNYDAHDFLDQAIKAGSAALIIHDETKLPKGSDAVTVIKVKDTLLALQVLALFWRKKNKFKVVAITGSNGKTTTKEFAHTILSAKYKCCKSPESFNNHWGVPISLLSVDADADYAIIEMGMNHKGEIAKLCRIALPDITLVTTVGTSHIGEVGSQQGIADSKEEIYLNSPKSIPIFNMDNEFTIEMRERTLKRGVPSQFCFSSFNKDCSVFMRAEKLYLDALEISGTIQQQEKKVTVPVFGRHNVNNLMAASCIALACGMEPAEIWEELPKCKSIWGRNELYHLENGASILFDGYNANFESMSAIIKCLFELDIEGKRFAVIGQMLELGDESHQLHHDLGELVAMTNFEYVWFIGADKDAFERGIRAAGFDKTLYLSDTYEERLAIEMGSMLNHQDIAVIKGSRGMKLERVLKAWKAIN